MDHSAALVIVLVLSAASPAGAGAAPPAAGVAPASVPARPPTAAPPPAAPAPAVPQAGTLAARVAIVTADLSVKPVPKQKFAIVAQDAAPIEAVTGFDGTLHMTLAPGLYRIRSAAPIDLEGRRLTWDVGFEIKAGGTTTIELSNDNALVEAAPAGAAAAHGLDAGALYERYRQGVIKVVADGGHGSGFLVGDDGLIITNHHVVADATFLAARLDDLHKHQVVVIAEDANHDIAVLRINPDTIRGRPVLVLADDAPGAGPVAVGDRVVAIGSPLTTETILTEGVVSKVNDDKIISDVSINPGNSGGPLLDARGRVIGINTFAMGSGQGPGLSGITRIHLALPILETARAAAKTAAPPPARALPVEAAYRFDPEVTRQEVFAHERDDDDYRLAGGKLNLMLITPMLIAADTFRAEREAEAGRKKRRKEQDTPAPAAPDPSSQRLYAWQMDEDNFRPVVTVRAVPAVKMSFGSAFKMSMIGRGGKLRFKTDFDRMELRRGDEVVEPIHPGRIKEVLNISGGAATLQDITYWGRYEYRPEAFEPGAPLVLRIWEQGEAEPQVITLSEELLARIREDFTAYLVWLRTGGK